MKLNIVKAIVLCTMALSLLFVGVASVSTADSDVVMKHDGHTNDGYVY